MQFDSQAQKAFVIECIRKYPCTIESALQFLKLYDKDIEAGSITIKQEDKESNDEDSASNT